MGENSKIEWCTHTFNPWRGCTKVSHGCTHCYAETLSNRWGNDNWGPKADRIIAAESGWKKPIKWNRDAETLGERHRVFCASLADVFELHMIPEVNAKLDVARARLWQLIMATPQLDWLLLTKRPQNILHMIPLHWRMAAQPNVWYGTSAENQETYDERAPHLIKVPAVVRFISAEPLLGPLTITDQEWWDHRYTYAYYRAFDPSAGPPIHWVIGGGESGPGARPMHPDWARALRDECVSAGVAYHFKQYGNWAPVPIEPSVTQTFVSLEGTISEGRQHPDGTWQEAPRGIDPQAIANLGKTKAGRLLDEQTWDQYPGDAVLH